MRDIVFYITTDFPEGDAKNALIKAYTLGLKKLGYNVKVEVAFSSKFNLDGVNKEWKASWNGIEFRYSSGDAAYPTNPFQKVKSVVLVWTRLLNILFQSDKKTVYFFYCPTLIAYVPLLVLLAWRGRSTIALQTERFSALEPNSPKVKIEEWAIAKYSKKILVLTQRLQHYYVERFGIDPRKTGLMTPIVVDFDRFLENDNGFKNKELRIGYLGTYGKKDGVNTIIDAFKLAQKEIQDLKLLLIGNCNGNTEKLGAEKDIEITGKLTYDEIPKYLMKCDLLIVNRLDDEYSRNGFPIKLAEYLATSAPVALIDFEEYHNYLSAEEVFYFKPNDVDDLAKTILFRYQNYENANEIGINGGKKCRKIFSKEVAAERLDVLLHELH